MRSFTETSPASILSDFGWLRVERSRHEDVLLAQREGRYLGVVNHVIESKSTISYQRVETMITGMSTIDLFQPITIATPRLSTFLTT